jgi:RNA polymerase sigma-70 factor (ECF subfamily)
LDPVAVETLLKNASWLGRLARALARDPAEAEDVLQETWLKAIERPPRSERGLRSWLAAVARTIVLDRHRAKSRRERRERTVEAPSPVPDPAVLAERAEIHRRLVDHVLALPEPGRSTVLLRYFEGMTPQEIALRTGEPASTVRSRLLRALDDLKARLDATTTGGREAWTLLLAPLGGVMRPVPPVALPADPCVQVLKGAILVSAKSKIAAAIAVLLLLLAGWWLAVSRWPEVGDQRGPPARAPEVAGAGAPARAGGVPVSTAPGTPGPGAPEGATDLAGSAAEAEPMAPSAGPPPAAGVIEGRVIVPEGVAPGIARVMLTLLSSGGEEEEIPVALDAGGAFRAKGLSPGRYRLVASHPDFAPWRTWFDLLPDRGAGPFLIELRAGGAIEVRILGERGLPRAGETIGFYGEGAAETGATDAEGRFRRENLAAGSYRLTWAAAGARVDRPVTVEAGRTTEVVLLRDARLGGTVLGPDGAALDGAIVRLRLQGPEAGYTAFQESTDDRGRFAIDGIVPGTYLVDVQSLARPPRPGYVCEVGNITFEPGDRVERTLQVAPTVLSGRVTRKDDGTPLTSFPQQIQITACKATRKEDGGVEKVPGSFVMAFADAEGRYEFVGLDPGLYEIWISSIGADVREVRRVVEVPREGLRDIDFAMEVRRYGTLRLRVLLPDGEPAGDLEFGLLRRVNDKVVSLTVPLEERGPGLFDLTLEEGAREVSIGKPGYRADPELVVVDVLPEAVVERTVRLVRTGEIRLTVIEPDGSQAETARVLLVEGETNRPLIARRLGAGVFRVFPDPGERILRVETDTGLSYPVRVVVDPEAAVAREVRLSRK